LFRSSKKNSVKLAASPSATAINQILSKEEDLSLNESQINLNLNNNNTKSSFFNRKLFNYFPFNTENESKNQDKTISINNQQEYESITTTSKWCPHKLKTALFTASSSSSSPSSSSSSCVTLSSLKQKTNNNKGEVETESSDFLKPIASIHSMMSSSFSEVKVEETTTTALEKLENHFGADFLPKLICDNTNIVLRKTNNNSSIINSSFNLKPINNNNSLFKTDNDELNAKKKRLIMELSAIERKQADLIVLLYNNVYKKVCDELGINNNSSNYNSSMSDDFNRVFLPIVELEKVALMLHGPVASDLKQRTTDESEWNEKSFMTDILKQKFHFYKIYRVILERYPTCQLSLSILLKKRNFASCVKKYLVSYRLD
jgi:hypothetical protein